MNLFGSVVILEMGATYHFPSVRIVLLVEAAMIEDDCSLPEIVTTYLLSPCGIRWEKSLSSWGLLPFATVLHLHLFLDLDSMERCETRLFHVVAMLSLEEHQGQKIFCLAHDERTGLLFDGHVLCTVDQTDCDIDDCVVVVGFESIRLVEGH